MAEKVKEFFQKKKLDYKFSKAGTGHKLSEEPSKPKVVSQPPPQRQAQSSSSAAAGAAALSRLEKGSPAIKSSKEVYNECTSTSQTAEMSGSDRFESPAVTIGSGIDVTVCMFCPICNDNIPESHIYEHIHHCLQKEYIKEPLSSSVHMIQTLCKSDEQKTLCVETICRYLDNVINNPTEVKYRKIRVNNKNFQDRLLCVTGSELFLKAVGFQQELLPYEDNEAKFYVLPENIATKTDELEAYKQLLLSATPLKPELDRNPLLFIATSKLNHFDLPDSFYNMSIEEIRKEQKLKTVAMEKESVLRTKAMRERDETRAVLRYYRFVVVRIRFPEGVILQGIFWPFEQFSEVRKLVFNHLIDPTRLYSLTFLQKTMSDDTATLAQLGMVPAAVLNLSWTDSIQCGGKYDLVLKPDIVKTLKKL